ncbi:MAG: hypothetical protein R2731_02435 [Nocardioides sp.]
MSGEVGPGRLAVGAVGAAMGAYGGWLLLARPQRLVEIAGWLAGEWSRTTRSWRPSCWG